MKPILVLGPEEPGSPSQERGRVDFCRIPCSAEFVAGDGMYGSVIVINDGGAGTIHRLQTALAMRGRGGRLPIGVLTYLAAPGLGVDAGDPAPGDWLALWPQFRIDLKGPMLSLEYQAD